MCNAILVVEKELSMERNGIIGKIYITILAHSAYCDALHSDFILHTPLYEIYLISTKFRHTDSLLNFYFAHDAN